MAETPTRPTLASRRTQPSRPPTPPGPVAGHPVGPVVRSTAASTSAGADTPPGIPPHMASAVVTPRLGARAPVSATPAAPARPLHPTFAGPDQARRMHQSNAQALRNMAQGTATTLLSQATGLSTLLAAAKASPEATAAAEAEGLDLGLLGSFVARLQNALELTAPPPVASPPADAAPASDS